MRILVVTHAFPPEGMGGTERYADAVARALAQQGHEVAVFSGSLEWKKDFQIVRTVEAGLPVLRVHRSDLYFDHWDKTHNPHVARAFLDELARFRPEVVHLHHWIRLSNDLVRRAAAAGVPTVVHLHDLFVSCPRVFRVKGQEESCELELCKSSCVSCVPRWKFQSDDEIGAAVDFYRAELAAELAAASARLAPSHAHARFLATHAARTAEASASAAPAAPAFEVLPHPRLPGGIQGRGTDARSPAGSLRLLYFSHLLPMKGAHLLLAAIRALGPGSGVALDCCGAFATADYEKKLRALAEGLEVRFHGAYRGDEPCRVPADVLVIPTLARESWSFWLDEAARLGLPILAADSEAIAERATGRVRLYPARDVAALAMAIRELRDDPARRARQAAAAMPEAMALDEHVARLTGILERAARRAASAPALPGFMDLDPALPDPGRLTYEWDRRELAFRELLRSEGWEEVLGRQQAEIERLRRATIRAPEAKE